MDVNPDIAEGAAEAAELFRRQVAALGSRDLDALIANYTEDAVLVRFDRVAHGRAEVRVLLADYLARSPRVLEPLGLRVTEDVITYRSRIELDGVEHDSHGTFVLRGGLIWRQTTAFVPL
ncbi:YybH family protein [Nocardiopsis ganjiahuensis]|uniref:YybH family protein n=1 Tax=Nocardiopsis ganjiahuensis TaxID=239984 RepID=UPI000374F6E6|nr:nuclear transport factor 2 family protein [Nocardiopsis ganjiahuensis]